MNEGEFNIDNEFEALLKDEARRQESIERKKAPYYTESIDPERRALIDAFYDHYVSLSSLEEIETVDDFLAASISRENGTNDDFESDDDTYDDGVVPKLNELLVRDVERFEVLASGEVQISGEGLYMFIPDNDFDADSEVLEGGATLLGDISQYAALPSIAYEDFLRMQQGEGSLWGNDTDGPVESPSPWLLMDNVVLYDASGIQQAQYDRVMVPLEYQSLYFKKVIRQDDIEVGELQEDPVPLATYFLQEFILNVCNDIENNLNHNQFDYDEFREEYEFLRQDIGVYMMAVDTEKEIRLTATEITFADGSVASFEDQVTQYVEPTIVKYKNAWRVAHAFMMQTEDGSFNVAHVLPEHIASISYVYEQ